MNLLTRDAVLESDDLPHKDVPVPEWGGLVRVRTLTAAERDAFEQSLAAGDGDKANLANIRARLCALCMVDEAGGRLFTDDDAARLGAKSGQALDRVFAAAQSLNAMGKAAGDAMEKNSIAGQTGASTSASALPSA